MFLYLSRSTSEYLVCPESLVWGFFVCLCLSCSTSEYLVCTESLVWGFFVCLCLSCSTSEYLVCPESLVWGFVVCLWLSCSTSEYLVCPESLPLHEVFYFSAVNDLRHRVCAAPRTAIRNALMRPYSYLKVWNWLDSWQMERTHGGIKTSPLSLAVLWTVNTWWLPWLPSSLI